MTETMTIEPISFEHLSREEQQKLAEEMWPRAARIFGFLRDAFSLEPGVPIPEPGIPPGHWRRLAERKFQEATSGGTVDWAKIEQAEKLQKTAKLQEAADEAFDEMMKIKAIHEAFARTAEERKRAEAIQKRQEARAAGDVDTLRELNRAQHRAGGRGRKKK